MKIYTYTNEQISKFPYFKERPWEPKGDNVIFVDNPNDADFIICPVALHRFRSRNMSLRVEKTLKLTVDHLPYWKQYERKHVFFDCSDFENSLMGSSAILIRCNVRDFMLIDKNTIPWYWPVEDLEEYSDFPDEFKYDVGFHGWLSTNTRKISVNSCKNVFGNKFNHKTFSNFYGFQNEKTQENRRKDFLECQKQSKILLCPQSIPGVFPYRFYEAMSAQRIPALFCTGYHLPFQKEIDWDKCTIRFTAEQAKNAGSLIKNFLNNTKEEKLLEMAKYGRKMWVKWLNRDKQQELVAYALKQKGKEIGLLK